MRDDFIPRPQLAGVLLCFFLSGAAGLIYQVAWSKALGLVFGHTVYAIATVLAVFMGGLALGSAVLGRASERHARPVALYGWIELGVAVTGTLSLVGLAGVRALYQAAYPALADSTAATILLRFVGAALVLLLPTFLMGGTLPILVRGLTSAAADSAELGARISRLYWVNTAGAVAGTLVAGFFVLPAVGLRLTVALAAALNVGVAALALWLARGIPAAHVASAEVLSSVALPDSAGEARKGEHFLLGSFAVVGATAMAYEIAWTRLLVVPLGSSTYAFTLMLGTFLAGIVLGSWLFEKWAAGGRTVSAGSFATTQIITALAALAFLVSFPHLPEVVPAILQTTGENFRGVLLVQFVASALVMLPAATVFGFNFPLVTLLIAGREGESGHGAAVGRAYAANTLGAIAGATTTGFWLVPKVGSFRLVGCAAAANVLLALVLLAREKRAWRALFAPAALLAAAVGVAWSGAFYNRAVASFGAVLYWDLYKGLTVAEMAATTDLPYVADGLNASVAVATAEDYIALRTNGKVDASNHDRLTQLMMGHLGAIFHPDPRRVLVIGFGSGMTVSALTLYPEVERIDCVEIEPAVVRAAPHLGQLNRGVLRDPRVRIIFDDARNYLLTTRERYDLIVSEPSNPWIAGVATLFTSEFYREARARLRAGGMFVQWVQAYSLYPDDFRMVLATFVPRFPRVTLWRGEAADFLLLAQTDAHPLTLERLEMLWLDPSLRADFEALGLRRAEGIVAYHRLDDADLRRLAAGAPLNTDDHTRLEYRAPRALLADGLEDRNNEMVSRASSELLPRDLRLSDPGAVILATAETLLNLEEEVAAEPYVNRLADQPPTLRSALVRARWYLARNRLDDAHTAYELALALDRTSLAAAHGLTEVARRRGQFDTAELLLRQVLARESFFPPALEGMMQLERARARWHEAAQWQSRRIALGVAGGAGAYARLGELLIRAGEEKNGEEALLQALQLDPYSYAANRDLANLYRERKDWPRARRHLELVERYTPDGDAAIYVALAEVYTALSDTKAAQRALRKGLRVFPQSEKLLRGKLAQ